MKTRLSNTKNEGGCRTDGLPSRFGFRLWVLLLVAGQPFVACEKDGSASHAEESAPDESDPEAAGDDNFHKLLQVRNLYAGSAIASSGALNDLPLLYSLERNKAYDAKYLKSNVWDLYFWGTKNTNITANNGSNPNNPNSGGWAEGGVAILQKHFDEVDEVPVDIVFKTGAEGYGLDHNGSYSSSLGWVLYDAGGSLANRDANMKPYDYVGYKMYSGEPYNGRGCPPVAEKDEKRKKGEKVVRYELESKVNPCDLAHVAYSLGEGMTTKNGTVVPPRTLIIRTANGHHAKLKMIRLYKEVLVSDGWFRDSPAPYFSFDYVMIPKGEKKFTIKP